MTRTARIAVSTVALLALGTGSLRVHPCADAATCPETCPTDAPDACDAPAGDHDHETPAPHACDCPCHVPAVATRAADGPVRDAPTVAHPEARLDPLLGGFPHPPFKPPTA